MHEQVIYSFIITKYSIMFIFSYTGLVYTSFITDNSHTQFKNIVLQFN